MYLRIRLYMNPSK